MQSTYNSIAFAIYIAIAATGCVLALLIIRQRSPIHNMLRAGPAGFWVLTLTYLIRPSINFATGNDYFFTHLYEHYEDTAISSNDIVVTAAIFAITITAYAAGYCLTAPNAQSFSPRQTYYYDAKGLLLTANVFTCIGYLAILFRPSYSFSRTDMGTVFSSGTAYTVILPVLAVTGAALRYAVTRRLLIPLVTSLPIVLSLVVTGHHRFLIVTIAAIFIVPSILTANPQRASWRTNFHLPKKRLKTITSVGIAAALALSLIVFFLNVTNINRKAFASYGSFKVAAIKVLSGKSRDPFADAAGFETSIVTISRVRLGKDKIQYGTRNIYKLSVLAVPRALWPQKPYPAEFTWDYILHGRKTSNTDRITYAKYLEQWSVRGYVGAAIYDWGWFLFIAPSTLLGLLTGKAEGWCTREPQHPSLLVLYAAFLSSFAYIGRGPLEDNFGNMAVAFYAPLLLSYLMSSRRTPTYGLGMRNFDSSHNSWHRDTALKRGAIRA